LGYHRIVIERIPLLLVSLTVGCFDAALPATSTTPNIACFTKADCPIELPICIERLGTCIAAGTPCIGLDGEFIVNGNTCGPSNICIDGACIAARCGDSHRSFDEPCDDGNDVDTDGCLTCVLATCGDGILQAGVEVCDSTPRCSADCTPLPCTDGEQQCDDADVEICIDGVFDRLINCAVLQGSCTSVGNSYFCESDLGEPCFDGQLLGACIEGVCNITDAASGVCTANACEGPRGACLGAIFQSRCAGSASLLIDCASIDRPCVENVGCVSTSGQSCIPGRTPCDAGNGLFDPCPLDGLCPPPFVDMDGNTRGAPQLVSLPATNQFDLTPARDEDCVQFTIAVTQSVQVTATMAEVNCVVGQSDPAVEVVDSDGRILLAADDVNDVDLCVGSVVSLPPGSYRACVMESKIGERGVLQNVTLGVEVIATTTVTLPFSTTLATLSVEPTCFSFSLTAASRVTVDAGVNDPRCPNTEVDDPLDTVASLEGKFVDDVGSLLCAVLTTEDPLPPGRHVACVSSFAFQLGNVPVAIRLAP
jgi:cysteine-rich repeat protein